MACEETMALEQTYLRNLEAATMAIIRGEALELQNDSGVLLVFAPDEASE